MKLYSTRFSHFLGGRGWEAETQKEVGDSKNKRSTSEVNTFFHPQVGEG